MDRKEAGLPGAAWLSLVRTPGLALLPAAGLFWWWFAYDAYARDIFIEGAYIAASGGIAAIVVAITMSVWRAREAKRITTYGSARWAETSEVRQAGLLQPDGVVLGRLHSHYLRHDGPECARMFRSPLSMNNLPMNNLRQLRASASDVRRQ